MLLNKPAKELTILEVVNAVEPLQRIRTCPLGLAAHGVHLCPLHSRLDAALAKAEEALGSSTLADVLAELTRSALSVSIRQVEAASRQATLSCSGPAGSYRRAASRAMGEFARPLGTGLLMH